MTRLMDEAIATIARLPDAQQDELARALLQLAGCDQPRETLSPDEEADLDRSLAAEARGELAGDDEVRAVWAAYGL